jgi:pimeloyl-ACP methyl ester carboxylesterase
MYGEEVDGRSNVGNPVVALPCSGAGAGQWRALNDALGPRHRFFAPEHYGSEAAGPWSGTHAFRLADEAARTIDCIDRCESKVHLVGHSYGGGVALHAALARKDRVASLTLYEPSAFHLLKQLEAPAAASSFSEIAALAQETADAVSIGDLRRAATTFVDYWGGAGAWLALRPSGQAALMRWVPKASLDFHALMEEPTPLGAYASLTVPVLILRGEYAPRPARLIAETLSARLSQARCLVVEGAGHMGPLTRATFVSRLIADHVAAAEVAAWPPVNARTRRPGRHRAFALPSLGGAVL